MSDHPIHNMMDLSMEKIREMVDANTIIGTPITTPDGTTLIPVSKISVGFASGGADFGGKERRTNADSETVPQKFGGGTGAGINITPIAFIVITENGVRMLPVGAPASTTVDRIVDMVPEVLERAQHFIDKQKASAVEKAEAHRVAEDTL